MIIDRYCQHTAAIKGLDYAYYCTACHKRVDSNPPTSEREDVVLVAVTVIGAESNEAAQRLVMDTIVVGTKDRPEGAYIDGTWIAEDNRIDGSDCESAVFCKPGFQSLARNTLEHERLTGEPNYSTWTPRAQRQRERFGDA